MGLKELIGRYAYCKPNMIGWYSLVADAEIVYLSGQKATAEDITRCESEVAGIDIHVRKSKVERVDIITKPCDN